MSQDLVGQDLVSQDVHDALPIRRRAARSARQAQPAREEIF
jgi:hypothetical protein